jgi:hypothetical protein
MSRNSNKKCTVWWDYENTPTPRGVSPAVFFSSLRNALSILCLNICDVKIYGSGNSITDQVRIDYQAMGAHCINTAIRNKKETADMRMAVDIAFFAFDSAGITTEQPAIVLITGDTDFASLCSKLMMRNFEVILACNKQIPENLRIHASRYLYFSDVLALPDNLDRRINTRPYMGSPYAGDALHSDPLNMTEIPLPSFDEMADAHEDQSNTQTRENATPELNIAIADDDDIDADNPDDAVSVASMREEREEGVVQELLGVVSLLQQRKGAPPLRSLVGIEFRRKNPLAFVQQGGLRPLVDAAVEAGLLVEHGGPNPATATLEINASTAPVDELVEMVHRLQVANGGRPPLRSLVGIKFAEKHRHNGPTRVLLQSLVEQATERRLLVTAGTGGHATICSTLDDRI